MAKKPQKRSASKKGSSKPPKAAGKASAKPAAKAPSKAKVSAPVKRAAAPSLPASAPAAPSLGEQAERLRDEIQRSKLTHPDPWTYGVKARTWGVRAQALVEQIAVQGDTPAARRTLATLEGEVQGDRDFREARRLF